MNDLLRCEACGGHGMVGSGTWENAVPCPYCNQQEHGALVDGDNQPQHNIQEAESAYMDEKGE